MTPVGSRLLCALNDVTYSSFLAVTVSGTPLGKSGPLGPGEENFISGSLVLGVAGRGNRNNYSEQGIRGDTMVVS